MAWLDVERLTVDFPDRLGGAGSVRAVDGVTFGMERGEAVGVVGESGSGKSTLANVILGLIEPSDGVVRFDGGPVPPPRGAARVAFRRSVQMVFQDPLGALNPRMTVGAALRETLSLHRRDLSARERGGAVRELLRSVEMAPGAADRYPHELSGGMRQRVCIARALAVRPALIVADEPVSALDVSVQGQILELLRRVRAECGLALLFIAHDLAVVRSLCERVLVMRRGRVVESGSADTLYANPSQAYTRSLLAAAPDVARSLRRRGAL